MSEYGVIGGVVALMGIAALVGVNSGLLQSLTGVKNTLGSASSALAGQTNQQIASALSALSATASSAASGNAGSGASASSNSAAGFTAVNSSSGIVNSSSGIVNSSVGPGGGSSTSSGTSTSTALASLNTAQALLSQIDPTNLPEVSGSSSDIATLNNTAALLVQVANQLEAQARMTPGLDVTQLVYNARRLAAVQLAVAGDNFGPSGTAGTLNIYEQKATDLANLLLKQNSSDSDMSLLLIQVGDLQYNPGSNWFDPQLKSYKSDFSQTYTSIAGLIQTQSLQTQQANTVLANGGNINNQNPVTTSGYTTIADANAINLCQNANCTVAGL